MAPFLLALVLGINPAALGRPTMRLDCTTFQVSDSVQKIEIDYDIPYTSVTFVRDSPDYVARFTVSIQCWDAKGNQVAAQDWDRTIRLRDYDSTVRGHDEVTGRESLRVAMGRFDADVAFQDQQSERAQNWQFKIEPPKYLSDLRIEPNSGGQGFTGAEGPGPRGSGGRGFRGSGGQGFRGTGAGDVFRSIDTLHVYFETYDRGSELDSGRAEITGNGRTYSVQQFAVAHDSWAMAHRLDFPLSKLDDGEYQLQLDVKGRSQGSGVRGQGSEVLATRKVSFQVGNSFFRLDRVYKEKVEELAYIASSGETEKLLKAAASQRESLWNAFWKAKDQTLRTQRNETEEEYFERIQYCIDHFGHGDKGWRSDRARVYVRLGPPDDVESHPFESAGNSTEVWSYDDQNLTLTFEDVGGFGEYKLVYPADFFQDQGW